MTSQLSSEIAFRSAVQDDMRFIMDSWLRSWRESPWAGCIRNDLYFATQRATIEGLIARSAEFIVAYLEERPDHILGWGCFEMTGDSCVVHYLYTKDPYLGHGINKSLVERASGSKPGFYTHRYRQVIDTCPDYRHAPEIARRK